MPPPRPYRQHRKWSFRRTSQRIALSTSLIETMAEMFDPCLGLLLRIDIEHVGLAIAHLDREHEAPRVVAVLDLIDRNDACELDLGTKAIVLLACNCLIDLCTKGCQAWLRCNHQQVVEEPQVILGQVTNLLPRAQRIHHR